MIKFKETVYKTLSFKFEINAASIFIDQSQNSCISCC